MATVYMTIGIPASGKSTYVNNMENVKVFSSDKIREEYDKKGKEYDNNSIFASLGDRLENALKDDEDVVFDATNMSRKYRMNYLSRIKKKYSCKIVCLLFLLDPKVAKLRNKQRNGNAVVPDITYKKMLHAFNTPYYYEGFGEIQLIPTGEFTDDFTMKDLMTFNQQNYHHKYTLGEHLKNVEEGIIKFAENEEQKQRLLDVARYHDIGKFYTKTFRSIKNDKLLDEAHYYGHENYGAYIFLCKFVNTMNKDDLLYKANLINYHMRPLTAWKQSKNAEEKDRLLLGEQMYNDLLVLHKADTYK